MTQTYTGSGERITPKDLCEGAGDSVVKAYISKGPGFGSQNRHGSLQLTVTTVPGEPMPSTSLRRHTQSAQVYMKTKNSYTQNF